MPSACNMSAIFYYQRISVVAATGARGLPRQVMCGTGMPLHLGFKIMVPGGEGSERNANIFLCWIKFRCKSTCGKYLLFFRLRAKTRPAAPIPINASVSGSGIAATLPLVSPGGLFLQAGKFGFWLQSGLSASSEVDTSNRSTAIIVFIIMPLYEKK
jgi:hypothetical protein